MEELPMRVRYAGDVAVISHGGQEAGAPLGAAGLSGLIDGGATRVVYDLSATDYISSVRLNQIIAARNRLEGAGGRICVVCPNPAVQEVFEITRLNELVSVFDDLDAALDSFARQ